MRLELTWRAANGETYTEVVEPLTPGLKLAIGGVPLISTNTLLANPDYSFFEDDAGIFAVRTDSIVDIKEIK